MTFKKTSLHHALQLVVLALLPLALLTACSTKGPTTGGTAIAPGALADNSGFGGEIVTDSSSTTATVVSVDHTKRLVVLKRADGSSVTYKAAPGAFGFEDIKAGRRGEGFRGGRTGRVPRPQQCAGKRRR